MELSVYNHNLILHPSGAVYVPQYKALLIADVHLGKITHFRKNGIALPPQLAQENYTRLNNLITLFSPEHIYFLGDLFHSTANSEWDLFTEWTQQQKATITLIVGNHDIIDTAQFTVLGITLLPHLTIGSLYLTHHPTVKNEFLNCCGHIHPGYTLRGLGKQVLKLRCFAKTENQLILPAFGEFTGNYYLKKNEAEAIYVCTKHEVVLVP